MLLFLYCVPDTPDEVGLEVIEKSENSVRVEVLLPPDNVTCGYKHYTDLIYITGNNDMGFIHIDQFSFPFESISIAGKLGYQTDVYVRSHTYCQNKASTLAPELTDIGRASGHVNTGIIPRPCKWLNVGLYKLSVIISLMISILKSREN